MQQRSFLKHTVVYGLGELLTTAGGIILLPLYTRRLTQADMGYLELADRVTDLFVVCLLLRSLPMATFVLLKQSRDGAQRGRVLGTSLLLVLLAILTGGFLLLCGATFVRSAFSLDSRWLVPVIVFSGLLDVTTAVSLAEAQARYASRFFVVVSLGQLITKVCLGVFFVVVLHWGAAGVAVASILRASISASLLVARDARLGVLIPDRQSVRELAHFLLPFLPGGICTICMTAVDRFLLAHYAGPAEVGAYGIGCRLANVVVALAATPLLRVWNSRMYEVADAPDAPVLFGRMITRILAAYLFVGLGVTTLHREVLTFFAGAEYAASGGIACVVVLAQLFLTAGTLLDAGFYIKRRTDLKLWITLSSAVTVVVLQFSLVPVLGGIGAAVATLVTAIVQVVLTYWLGEGIYPVRAEFGRMAAGVAMAIGLWWIGQQMPAGYVGSLLRIAIWLAWPGLVWWAGLPTWEERQWVRSVFSNLRGRPPQAPTPPHSSSESSRVLELEGVP
jgi:O-antigen/teichoic acid export membrane protein